MAFNVYEVVQVACQSKTNVRLTSDANDFVNAKSHAREKPLLGGQVFRLSCGQVGVLWLLKALLFFSTQGFTECAGL